MHSCSFCNKLQRPNHSFLIWRPQFLILAGGVPPQIKQVPYRLQVIEVSSRASTQKAREILMQHGGWKRDRCQSKQSGYHTCDPTSSPTCSSYSHFEISKNAVTLASNTSDKVAHIESTRSSLPIAFGLLPTNDLPGQTSSVRIRAFP